MKLLIFCPYYPPHIGGLESHADEFNKHMTKSGTTITVFTPRLPKEAPSRETKHGQVTIIRFPAFEIIANYPLPKFWHPVFWKQFSALFRQEYDIVISRTRFFFTSLLALLYAKLKRKPWIHIEHGSDYVQLNNTIFKTKARLYDITFGRLVLMLANDVIANSKASADFVRRLAPKAKPTVIYRGVSQEQIESTPPATTLRQQYPGTIITYVGRLIDGKGVTDLLRAYAKINHASTWLFIVGDGPQRAALKREAKKLTIADRVIFFGTQPSHSVIGILKISDIIVNPSYTEGLPTSVIEAALCKKAIVATNVGGTQEIISNGISGFLVPPRKPDMLAQKIAQLLHNTDQAASFGQAAYKHAQERFAWHHTIQRYQDIFSNYASSR
jgi:glycosyltransferase involved in cell wall biosynthesis